MFKIEQQENKMEKEKVPFLDVLVYKKGQKLKSDIYYRIADTDQYLNYNLSSKTKQLNLIFHFA